MIRCGFAGGPVRMAALAALGVMLLGGCSLFHTARPATQVYVLRTVAAEHPQSDPLSAGPSLHVGHPIASPGLDSDHIMLVEAGHRMSYYMASRWAANLPAVVEELTVDTLRASGAWSTVQDSNSGFPTDYLLQIVIRRFEADYTAGSGAPEIHVALDCTLGRRAGREVIASFISEGSATAAANRLADVVAAFEAASNKALDEIGARTAQAAKTAQKVDAPVPSMTR
ncbi:MAG: membrane integrity-associated transporter subunit PqiC [Sinobacteraceae bacterium]|nr:membrane integrity-associated transporter subunit PqiC [Nevskiaceae bacterium]